MNIINRFFLSAALLPANLYERMGVNVHHLRSILKAKLTIDDRRSNTLQQTRQKKDGKVTGSTIRMMLLSSVMGGFFLYSFIVGKDYVTQLTIYFSMYIFVLSSSLIADFTSVLIDIRDNYIILPKPVTDRTVVMARLLHIVIHVSKLVLPMSLPGTIYIAYYSGLWGGTILFLLLLLTSIFTIFLINALYIFILKVTTPQKFQSIISYFQIFFAIFIYACYQIIPRLMTKAALEDYTISNAKGIWLIPSYWFAAAWNVLTTFHATGKEVFAVAMSFIAPVASIYIVIKYFAPSFNQKLSLINSGNAEQTVAADKSNNRNSSSSYIQSIAKWCSKQGVERASFLLCWKMMGRSKDFKLKVYPSIGYMAVFLILPILKEGHVSIKEIASNKATGFGFIGLIYLSSFVLMTAISQLQYSEKYKAAWVYFIAPVEAPGKFISGALKAAIIKFYVPAVIIIGSAALIIMGPSIIHNLLLALFNEVLICSLVTYITVRQLPFSLQQSNNAKGGTLIKGLFMLIIPMTVAALHFLVFKITPVIYIFIIMSAIATWLVQGSIESIKWEKIKTEE